MHIEEHKVPRGRPPKSDSEIGPKQLKRRAKKIVDTFNEATKDNDVLKNIAISTLYTANFESINKMIKLRAQDDPLAEQDIVDIIVNAGLSERQLRTIVENLKTKWGPKIINVNVKNALAMRKKGLNKFFSVAI